MFSESKKVQHRELLSSYFMHMKQTGDSTSKSDLAKSRIKVETYREDNLGEN